MIHQYIRNSKQNSGDHYAVGTNSLGQVLLQVQENGEQARIILDIDEALLVVKLLQEKIEKAKNDFDS
jgi:hypothetical protein